MFTYLTWVYYVWPWPVEQGQAIRPTVFRRTAESCVAVGNV